MKSLLTLLLLSAFLISCGQEVKITKTPFTMSGKTFITTESSVVNGVQKVTFNFNEMLLPVSTKQALAIAAKTDNTAFTAYQKTVSNQQASQAALNAQLSAGVKVLQDSMKSLVAQVAVLKAAKTSPVVSNNVQNDTLLKSLKSELSQKVDIVLYNQFYKTADSKIGDLSNRYKALPALDLAEFNTSQTDTVTQLHNSPLQVTEKQRLLMKDARPGMHVYQTDGKKPGEYRFNMGMKDWDFIGL